MFLKSKKPRFRQLYPPPKRGFLVFLKVPSTTTNSTELGIDGLRLFFYPIFLDIYHDSVKMSREDRGQKSEVGGIRTKAGQAGLTGCS